MFHEGFGTRKECRKLIFSGKVRCNETIITECETHCEEGSTVNVDGEVFTPVEILYIAYNKKTGEECSHKPSHYASVYENFPQRYLRRGLECAGRLDVDTTGLLLFSDNGKFIHHIISKKRALRKTYLVTLAETLREEDRQLLISGIILNNETEPVRALSLGAQDDKWLIEIDEGRYHVVKRMFGACANRVVALQRVAIGDLTLGEIGEGQWVQLDNNDLEKLQWKI